jgi:hypothetical protein
MSDAGTGLGQRPRLQSGANRDGRAATAVDAGGGTNDDRRRGGRRENFQELKISQPKIRRHDEREPGGKIAERAVIPIALGGHRRRRVVRRLAASAATAHQAGGVPTIERDRSTRVGGQNDVEEDELICQ